jgi:hypothetical protein
MLLVYFRTAMRFGNATIDLFRPHHCLLKDKAQCGSCDADAASHSLARSVAQYAVKRPSNPVARRYFRCQISSSSENICTRR